MKKLLLLLLPVAFLPACHTAAPEQDAADYTVQGDTVSIMGGSALKAKLVVSEVKSEVYRPQMLTAGTVKAIPTQYAEIAPPFSGRVVKSNMRLGMRVTPETSLFEISSPDFMTAQKVFFQEKSQMQLAEKTLKRQEDLKANGVGTEKDLEEAQTAYDVARKEYENAVVGIKVFKADPDNLVLGQPLVVKAPISGEVIDNKIVVGKFINDNSSSIAIVAELSKVWVAGQIKEKDINYIHALDQCSIQVAAYPGRNFSGKVYHVNEMVDEDTRSVQVLIECDNRDHQLKPGMYVTVDFINAPTRAILIPSRAVLQANDQSYVYAEAGPDRYVKRKIETTGSDSSHVIISAGLQPGERIITEGSYYLSNAK